MTSMEEEFQQFDLLGQTQLSIQQLQNQQQCLNYQQQENDQTILQQKQFNFLESIDSLWKTELISDYNINNNNRINNNSYKTKNQNLPYNHYQQEVGYQLKQKFNGIGDRYIPERRAMNQGQSEFFLNQKENLVNNSFITQEQQQQQDSGFLNYHRMLESNLLTENKKIINLQQKNSPQLTLSEQINQGFVKSYKQYESSKPVRIIQQSPEKILDAPEFKDDYYLNLMDWGDHGVIAISLNHSVYLYNSYSGDIKQLFSTNNDENYISSVCWMQQKKECLAVGFANNTIQLWDVEREIPYRSLIGHTNRVSSLAWNNFTLSSGSRDNTIINHDVRAANSIINTYSAHTQEVCGLKWNPEGTQLASGSNDNNLMIWELNKTTPKYVFREHRAAVKALAWCPWQKNLLASGGGTADKTMKFWNTETGQLIQSIDTDSQVCSIIWNKHDKELISSHGYSKNQLTVWKYGTFQKVAELQGHLSRVLHMSLSPDGSSVCSAASDETLRFWRVFETPVDDNKKIKKELLNIQNNNLSLR